MNHTETLVSFMRSAFPLQEKELAELLRLFSERTFKRRGILLHHGDTCRHFTFVVAGCLKMYAIDQAGKEHILEFAAEQEWISDLESFYAEKPGQVYLEALERTVVLQISRADLIHIYATYPRLNSTFRIIIERKYIEQQKRMLQNISATAEERYRDFVQRSPALAARLANTQVASYLGITPEFLSKIRSDWSHR